MMAMIVITTIFAVALTLFVLSVRTKHRAFVCPINGAKVRLRYLESFPRGRPLEVTECSAFDPPDAVICDQRCLALLADPATSPSDKASRRPRVSRPWDGLASRDPSAPHTDNCRGATGASTKPAYRLPRFVGSPADRPGHYPCTRHRQGVGNT